MFKIVNEKDYQRVKGLKLISLTKVSEQEAFIDDEKDVMVEWKGETEDGLIVYVQTFFGEICVGLDEREFNAEHSIDMVGEDGDFGRVSAREICKFLKWTVPKEYLNLTYD
jgi:hypothetical protein